MRSKPMIWGATVAASLGLGVLRWALVAGGRARDAGPGALDRPLAVRLRPTPLTFYPVGADAATEAELIEAARVARPYFRRNKVPVVLVYHALRLWGPHAPFSHEAV